MKAKMRFLLPYLAITSLVANHVMSQSLNCANPADIMFLLDGSDSINNNEWIQERNFLGRMINSLDISPSTINVGFVVYSSGIDSHFSLTPYRPKIILEAYARSLVHPTGIATNTARGIEKIRETFRQQPASRQNVPKILIVITDGSSENPAETINQARQAKAEGIRIMSVAVGNNVFVEELEQIASTKKKFYRAADFSALQGIEKDIQNMICRVITTTQSPSMTFAPPTPPPNLVPIAGDRICNNPGDIVFVIDGSASISDMDFKRLKNFVANLIDNFEIGPDAIHVGMIVYSTLIGETIGLYPPKNKLVLKLYAQNLQHPKVGTDTAKGIEAARKMILEQGRPTAPEIIIVITDGRSSNPSRTVMQAGIAKAQGITMIAIGVGKDKSIFADELKQIASGPNYLSEVTDFTALQNTVNVMRNLICTSITTTSTTTTTMMAPTPPPSIPPPSDDLNCKVPGDIVFLLDGSDSIKPADWVKQRNFVANMINNLEIGQPYIHASVVVFSSVIGDEIPLVPFNPKQVLNAKVKDLTQPRFGTNTATGIQRAVRVLLDQGRANAPRLIIVMTDGKSTDPENTAIHANIAKAMGAIMISIGIGSDVFESELYTIASGPTKVYKVLDFAALRYIITSLRDTICRVVQTTTVAPVTTPIPTTTTTQLSTPLPVPLTPCPDSRTAADIVFMMDGSQVENPYNWMMETHFVSNILDGLDVHQDFVHAGVVVADSVRGDMVGTSPFKSRFHLKELIHGMMHPRGEMNTAAGLRTAADIFRNQGRGYAQKLVVAVTDGSSKSMMDTIREANKLKSNGVKLVTVGVGNGINLAELRSVASVPQYALIADNFQNFFGVLPNLQQLICQILREGQITTTPIPTTTAKPGLCDGCLIDQGVGFNPFPGDCTKYVQCWKEGDKVRALIRSCPFGQFWDSDAITCRPSFLVNCTADPCKYSISGFTYGMSEYGCRAYWQCIDGFSLAHCCPMGSSYVEGMGCLMGTGCNDKCPPDGGTSVLPVCDKKTHWDKRYYIQIVYGRGEVVRPCPVGTIFFEEKCGCDFGMSALLPATPNVLCQPSALFPFDSDIKDRSLQAVNTGVTNVERTDLGTAYFNGRSNMNLWRFAGTDWGNQLVIKFKFRFDYSNKFIDYGGLPVDLGVDFDINMDLISDYHMTDMDWRLWNQLRNVRNLADWRRLLQEFGKAKTFYVFLGQLGFKPGTSNSQQVVTILGTPEAFAEFRLLLQRLQPSMLDSVNLNDRTTNGLKGILKQLRSMRKLINWDSIIRKLKGDSQTGGQGTGQEGISGNAQYQWDGISGKWVKIADTVTGGGSIGGGAIGGGSSVNMGGVSGTGSDWRWNSVTGQWERLASVSGGTGPSGGSDVTFTNTKWVTGPGGNWSTQGGAAGSGGFSNWMWRSEGSTSSQTAGAAIGATGGAMGTQGGGFSTQGGSFGAQGGNIGSQGGNVGTQGGNFGAQGGFGTGVNIGTAGSNSGTGSSGGFGNQGGNVEMSSIYWQASGATGANAGSGAAGVGVPSGNMGMTGGNMGMSGGTMGMSGGGNMGITGGNMGMTGGNMGMSGGTMGISGGGNMGMTGGNIGMTGSNIGMTGSNMGMTEGNMGMSGSGSSSGSFGADGINYGVSGSSSGVIGTGVGGAAGTAMSWEEILRQLQNMQNLQNSSSSWTWRTASSSKGGNIDANREAIEALLRQLKLGGGQGGSATWQWTKTGGTASGQELDLAKLDAILKQMRQAGSQTTGTGSQGMTSGTSQGSGSISGVKTVQFTTNQAGGGSGTAGATQGTSKRTIKVRQENEFPSSGGGVNIQGGVVVGGTFSGSGPQTGSMTVGASDQGQGQQGNSGSSSGGFQASFQTSSQTGFTSGGQTGSQAGAQTGSQTGVQTGSQTGSVAMETSSRRNGNGNAGTINWTSRIRERPIGTSGTVLTQTVEVKSQGGSGGIQDRSVPRGAQAKGVRGENVDGQIIGIKIPNQGDFVSGATVIGRGDQTVKVTNTGPQVRVKEIVQEIQPTMFEAQEIGASGSSSGSQGGGWSTSGGASGGFVSGGFASGGSGMAGGDYTQLGRVAGSGGGVKRIIDTNIKRVPAGSVQINADGGVNLASLGLGGAEGTNIIRQTVRVGADGTVMGGGSSGSSSGSSASGGGFSSSGGSQGSFSMSGGGGGNGQFIDINTLQGRRVGQSTLANQYGQSNTMALPFLMHESAEGFFDSLVGKKRRKRSARSSRNKRAINKQTYQALVTNCQGQNGKGPSIMVVANQNDVQFALKTYNNRDPGIVSVPAVEGWNDVTLIYDGKTLTGVVENWKGFHKSTVNLSGDIERRQAGLLVGSCQGFASFHGEIDDLTVYNCLTPAAVEMRDRLVL